MLVLVIRWLTVSGAASALSSVSSGSVLAQLASGMTDRAATEIR
jgi:hypothetical protein